MSKDSLERWCKRHCASPSLSLLSKGGPGREEAAGRLGVVQPWAVLRLGWVGSSGWVECRVSGKMCSLDSAQGCLCALGPSDYLMRPVSWWEELAEDQDRGL